MERLAPHNAVTIRYRMISHHPGGSDKPAGEKQLEFIYMIERQVPTLEKALEGRRAGDRLDLLIPAEELYGPHDPELVREIPKEGLVKQRLRQGRYYRQIRKSCLVEFKVLELRDDTILADFNNPMAGVTVSMTVDILGIRQASEDEIGAAREDDHRKTIGCG